jgi:glycosyltransferase involved in cell wall biosynthesis
MMISVVIPTYNRIDQLSEVVDHLLNTETEGLFDVEIIVVDDGSALSPEPMLLEKKDRSPFPLRLIRQENGGPARARNRGLSEANGELVLFVDDDVLVTPQLLREHFRAHQLYPKSVIFGPYPYTIPTVNSPDYRYLKMLVDEVLVTLPDNGDFVRVQTVGSGNLSIEKGMFPDGLYDESVTTPVAEEFSLIYNLIESDIPTYTSKKLTAWHTQPPFLKDKCVQEFKYGLGIAEIVHRRPKTLTVPALYHMYRQNSRVSNDDVLLIRFKKSVKALCSSQAVRNTVLFIVSGFGRILPIDHVLFPLFRFVVGLHFFAGVREGIRRFGDGGVSPY